MGTIKGTKFSEEHRRNMSLARLGRIPWNKGKRGVQISWRKGLKMTKKEREKMRLTSIKYWNSPDGIKTREKISSKLVGRKIPQEVLEKRKANAKINPNYGMRGKKHSEESRLKMSSSRIGKCVGSKNPAWMGDYVGRAPLHQWIAKYRGRPKKCEHCGTTENRKYEWANKYHTYKRNLKDYIRLCTSCHRKWDIRFNNYTGGISKSKYVLKRQKEKETLQKRAVVCQIRLRQKAV